MIFPISLAENVSNIVNIRKWKAIIRNKKALFRKENTEKLDFFFKISYEMIFVKQREYNRHFHVFKKTFNRDQYI